MNKFIFCASLMLMGLAIPLLGYAQVQEGEIREEGDTIVRYDILEMAKNLTSCAAYYGVTEQPEHSTAFTEEAKWLFMVDAAQTEEETATWVAGAYAHYHGMWHDIKIEDTFEALQALETQRRECYNLGVAKKIKL